MKAKPDKILRAKTHKICKVIGRKIAELRDAKDLSQPELAAKLGVTVDYLRRVETKGPNFTMETLVWLCDYFGIELADVIPASQGRKRKSRGVTAG